jgi:hypothetical protein
MKIWRTRLEPLAPAAGQPLRINLARGEYQAFRITAVACDLEGTDANPHLFYYRLNVGTQTIIAAPIGILPAGLFGKLGCAVGGASSLAATLLATAPIACPLPDVWHPYDLQFELTEDQLAGFAITAPSLLVEYLL